MDTEKTFRTRFDGRIIEFKAFTQGQLIALQSMNALADVDPEDADAVLAAAKGMSKSLHRMFRMLESRLVPQEWARVDEAMVLGSIDLPEIMNLVAKMAEKSGNNADQDKPVA